MIKVLLAVFIAVFRARPASTITEGEDPDASLAKLRASIAEFIADPEERSWVEPRLAHLLGLEERTARDQADLFSAWRLYFERIAERGVTTMVFEDLHWADSAMLDFIEYLVDWVRDLPIFVLAFARTELIERRPGFGSGPHRSSLALQPLDDGAMSELLDSLVADMPAGAGRVIADAV